MSAASRVTGHTLRSEGAAYRLVDDRPKRVRPSGTSGSGRALCSCGATSDELATGRARREWHGSHKIDARKDSIPLDAVRGMYLHSALRAERLAREVVLAEAALVRKRAAAEDAAADTASGRDELLRRGVDAAEIRSGRHLAIDQRVTSLAEADHIRSCIQQGERWNRQPDGTWKAHSTGEIVTPRELVTRAYDDLEGWA